MAEAKPIIKNKFWIIEENGVQVGTIQSVPDGVVLVQGQHREKFPSFKLLATKNNIRVSRTKKVKLKKENNVHGYPCDCEPYSPIYDLKLRLPLYTKEPKSKSFYCAGYYLIDVEGVLISTFCPKKIVLSRHKFHGPFVTKESLNECLSQIKS